MSWFKLNFQMNERVSMRDATDFNLSRKKIGHSHRDLSPTKTPFEFWDDINLTTKQRKTGVLNKMMVSKFFLQKKSNQINMNSNDKQGQIQEKQGDGSAQA